MKEEALRLPRTVKLKDGAEVTLRAMQRSDREAFGRFASGLSDHDLLFLRTDITDPLVIEAWLDNIDGGRTVTVVAERAGEIVGYGSLHMANATWSQHVGEIRVLASASMRGLGLGHLLTEAVFAQALDRGIEKIVAQFTIDQKGAIATFEELGFRAEALLRDHVKDRTGEKHDLLVFSHDVANFASQLDAYGVSDAAGAN
jgi:RimJ/RimL family protein N-acetyltransferase